MRLKWVSLLPLALLLGSCASLLYSKPPWGTSSEPYPILTGLADLRSGLPVGVYEVPSQNEIQLELSKTVYEVYDRGGNVDDLRAGLVKYLQWKDQLKDTGGKVSKPIIDVAILYPGQDQPGVFYSLHSFALSFETGSDGKYYLLATEMIGRSLGGGSYAGFEPTRTSFLFGEDQVIALSQALSQENLLAKAKDADEVANQKAEEERRNQALQQSLQ